MSFGVSDNEIAVTIEKMEGGKSVQSLLMSNDPLYVIHFTSIFEELWKNGIDAADRIRNIEEGVYLAEVEVIQILQAKYSLQSLCQQRFCWPLIGGNLSVNLDRGWVYSLILYPNLDA